MTPERGSVDTGYLALRLDVEMRDPDWLPDELPSGPEGYGVEPTR